ncbi:MAG TPA: DUF433 domain-containing protein [Ignavibacteria bacterium]|mgnify:CR=1 FL=1|jgi:uncharacterized protein (DUF433 family)|nr:DUF433 domain-containing protein [Ignavibacteria bacterium]
MKINIVDIDPEIQGGRPVFRGTRVPIETLFMHLEKGISLDDFLDDFPSVKKEQAIELLEIAEGLVTAESLK